MLEQSGQFRGGPQKNNLINRGLRLVLAVELATSNIFIAKDGVVFTSAPNGTFLAGITRQRVISLLREDGVTVA